MKIVGHPVLSMENQNYTQEIRKHFHNMKTYHDFLELLHFSLSHPDFCKKVPTSLITIDDLWQYGNPTKNGAAYTSFQIEKKSGGFREIDSPENILKLIQKCILLILEQIYVPHKSAHGFVKGKNVATNASVHVGKKFVLNVDIKDFFASTSFHKIKFLLKNRPFYLNGEKEHLAQLIANVKRLPPKGSRRTQQSKAIWYREVEPAAEKSGGLNLFLSIKYQ